MGPGGRATARSVTSEEEQDGTEVPTFLGLLSQTTTNWVT